MKKSRIIAKGLQRNEVAWNVLYYVSEGKNKTIKYLVF